MNYSFLKISCKRGCRWLTKFALARQLLNKGRQVFQIYLASLDPHTLKTRRLKKSFLTSLKNTELERVYDMGIKKSRGDLWRL